MTTEQTKPILVLTCGKGGTGKTIVMALLADYLKTKGVAHLLFDGDDGADGRIASFSYWCGNATKLNVRDPLDCDSILDETQAHGVAYTLLDLPSNCRDLITKWLEEVGFVDGQMEDAPFKMLVVGVVPPRPGEEAQVVHWMTYIGDRAMYLVALNRCYHEGYESPTEKAFANWFDVEVPALVPSPENIKTVEIPSLEIGTMQTLIGSGKLPSDAPRMPELLATQRMRIKSWRNRVFAQLDETGLF